MSEPRRTFERIAFIASDQPEARLACERLTRAYGDADPAAADVIVALGGDGLMLHTLRRFMHAGLPIYGMNRGSVGFLMNEYREEGLRERLAQSEVARLRPLAMTAIDRAGVRHEALAINEVSIFRVTHQTAKLRISVDGQMRLAELVCDGVMVATPAGSTAYNLSAHGPILPIMAPLLALTPISPFRPRRWRGALLPNRATIAIDVLEPDKRPVSAAADNVETRAVARVEVAEARHIELAMLFDADHGLEERILAEQFKY